VQWVRIDTCLHIHIEPAEGLIHTQRLALWLSVIAGTVFATVWDYWVTPFEDENQANGNTIEEDYPDLPYQAPTTPSSQ